MSKNLKVPANLITGLFELSDWKTDFTKSQLGDLSDSQIKKLDEANEGTILKHLFAAIVLGVNQIKKWEPGQDEKGCKVTVEVKEIIEVLNAKSRDYFTPFSSLILTRHLSYSPFSDDSITVTSLVSSSMVASDRSFKSVTLTLEFETAKLLKQVLSNPPTIQYINVDIDKLASLRQTSHIFIYLNSLRYKGLKLQWSKSRLISLCFPEEKDPEGKLKRYIEKYGTAAAWSHLRREVMAKIKAVHAKTNLSIKLGKPNNENVPISIFEVLDKPIKELSQVQVGIVARLVALGGVRKSLEAAIKKSDIDSSLMSDRMSFVENNLAKLDDGQFLLGNQTIRLGLVINFVCGKAKLDAYIPTISIKREEQPENNPPEKQPEFDDTEILTSIKILEDILEGNTSYLPHSTPLAFIGEKASRGCPDSVLEKLVGNERWRAAIEYRIKQLNQSAA